MHKRNDRLSRLWDNLLFDQVPPHPVAAETVTVADHLGVGDPISAAFAPDFERVSFLSEPETEPESFVTAPSYAVMEEDTATVTMLEEEERVEPLLVSTFEPDPFTSAEEAEPLGHPWRDSLGRLLHSLVELEKTADSPVSAEETNSEAEAFSDGSLAAAHEESLSFSTPFRWDPRPEWVKAHVQPKSPVDKTVDVQRLVYRSKIPRRPLHKQRFHRRLFFYLRGWLSGKFRKTV